MHAEHSRISCVLSVCEISKCEPNGFFIIKTRNESPEKPHFSTGKKPRYAICSYA